MATIKVYRNGSLSLPEHSEDVQQAWTPYDSVKPAERSGRLTSLYASPTLTGVTRWVKGNHLVNGRNLDADLTTHEITVSNPETVFVYSIASYDASHKSYGVKDDGAKKYWESGIRLTEWESKAADFGLDATEWEILLPVENIKSAKVVGNQSILNAVEDEFEKDQLQAAFRERKRMM